VVLDGLWAPALYGGGMHPVRTINSEQELRDMLGEPTDLVRAKLADRLNDLTRQFIERSPFVCVATGRPDGGMDVSPRGDPPGFVRVLDERAVLVPERPGNRLADTLINLLSDARIALLFLIPGVGDTFRVNGTGGDHRRPRAARPERGRGKYAAARDPGLGDRGLHAVLEGDDPL